MPSERRRPQRAQGTVETDPSLDAQATCEAAKVNDGGLWVGYRTRKVQSRPCHLPPPAALSDDWERL